MKILAGRLAVGSWQDLLTFFIDSSSFEKEALITDFM
jgi:hypothetical protein